MSIVQARFSREEFARRGAEIYERVVRTISTTADENKFVAIDIESSDFELDVDDFAATERLLTRNSGAQIWLMRVGEKAAYRIGRRLMAGERQ